MNQETLFFILTFILPLSFALALTPLTMALAKRWNWVDRPGHRKSHKKPVPYLGGVALFVALTLGLALAKWLTKGAWPEGTHLSSLVVCLIPALLGMTLGLWDDVRDIRVRHKFFIQVLIALVFSIFAFRFRILHVPGFVPIILDPFLSVLLSTFFILALVNGYNMIDGSDGLCVGSSIATLLTLAAVSTHYAQPHLFVLSLAAVGASLGFLYWNRPPARSYLGDAGSQGLGFLIACMLLAVAVGEPGTFQPVATKAPVHYKMVVAVLLAGYASAEVLLTVLRRALQGRNLGRADQGHLHHRMLRLGLNPMFIMLLAMAFTLLCGEIVLTFFAGQKGLTTLLSITAAVVVALALQQLGFTRLLQRRWLDARRPHFAVAQHYMAMQNVKLTLTQNMDEVFLLISEVSAELGVERVVVDLHDERNQKTDHHWSWSRFTDTGQLPGPEAADAAGPEEKQHLSNERGYAIWCFEKSEETEHELEMELRVLMAEFMRHALSRLHKIFAASHGPQHNYPKKSKLSIKTLKNRLVQ